MQGSLSGLEPKNGWETGIQIPTLSHFIYLPAALHYLKQ